MVLSVCLLILWAWSCCPHETGGAEFRLALPGRLFVFPADHAAHPEFKTEWWYYTGHLQSQEGERFSYQLTFFRVGLLSRPPAGSSAWLARTLYFAHFALTDITGQRFQFFDRASRGALGLAGAATDRYHVWLGDWQAWLQPDGRHRLEARTPEISLALDLQPVKPPVIHGRQGVSQKAAGVGYASHYYSLTRLTTQGELHYWGRSHQVQGLSWMDHEFSSSQLAPEQVGWDWFSLQLSDGRDLMLYLLRHQDGTLDPHSSGTWVEATGSSQHLPWGSFRVTALGRWRSSRSGATYPAGWRLEIPARDADLTIHPTLPDQELITARSTQVTYWEGSVTVTGQVAGQPVTGRGYVELTGYAGSLGGRF